MATCFARFIRFLVVALMLLGFELPASAAPNLERELAQMFVGHSLTLRNFYQGRDLRYGSDGRLLGKSEPGYWSRDGMVEIFSVKFLKNNELIMQGKRSCVLFDPAKGELADVWTGDRVQITVELKPEQLTLQAVIPILQRVLLTSQDRLEDLVPQYWTNCLQRKVNRPDKHSPWECVALDKRQVPDFAGKKIVWDTQPPDTAPPLHNGMQLYALNYRVGYLAEKGMTVPQLLAGPVPIFQWQQRRTKFVAVTLVLSFTVGEDGKPRDIFIVSPAGMGVDDEAAEAMTKWKFSPATCQGQPCAVHARVFFEFSDPTSPFLR